MRDRWTTGRPSAFDQFESAEGRFELASVSPGSYAVTVEATDHAPASVNAKVTASGATDVGTVKLQPGGTVRGTVVDSGGAFVGGARITLTKARRDRVVTSFAGEPEIVTDRAGAFEVKGVAEGSFEITASHPDYARSLPVPVLVEPSGPTPDVRVVLNQGGRIEGSYRRRDGGPVPGAFVVATPLREESWRGGPLVPVRPDGTFAIEHVLPGRVRVTTMTSAGNMSRSTEARETEVRDGETATLDIVNREVLLHGRVTRSAGPVGALRIEARSPGSGTTFSGGGSMVPPSAGGPERMAAVTREDGSFEMRVDEPGTLQVNVSTADQRTSLPMRTVEVPDVESFAVELSFAGAPVAGVVVDRDTEAPIPHTRVAAMPRAPPPSYGAQATAGPDGRFQLELEPGDYVFSAYPMEPGHAHDSVRASVGPGGLADLRIALARGTRITGRATDTAGRPVAGAVITAKPQGEPYTRQAETLTDGSFEIGGLKHVDHQLSAWADSGAFAIVGNVAGGTLDQPVRMQPAARVAVQLVTPDGQPVPGITPRVVNVDGAPTAMGSCKAPTNASGATEVLTPAGRVVIMASRGRMGGYASVEVGPGETTSARITMKEQGPQ